MRKAALVSLSLVVLTIATLTCAYAAKYEIRDLGPYDGHIYAAAYAINESGRIAGRSGSHIVLWNLRGGVRSIHIFPEECTGEPLAMNNAGLVVGREYNTKTGVWQAILCSGVGETKDLGTLGGKTSEANGINDEGWVVGHSTTASGESKAFLWTPDKGMRELPLPSGSQRGAAYDINKTGQIVGYAGTSAVLWSADGAVKDLGTLSGSFRSAARSINNSGQVVGATSDAKGGSRAFLWTSEKEIVELPSLQGWAESRAEKINDSGIIVGWVRNTKGEYRAVAWDAEGNVTDLGTLPKGTASEAMGINSAGYIVGRSTDELGRTHSVLWAPSGK